MTRNRFTERLREAGLTAEEFADIVQVDPKTVQRWVAGRVPQRRHRPKVARALDTSEDVLWPLDLSASDSMSAANDGETGASGDVVASWGWSDDHDAPTAVDFLTAGDGPVDVIDRDGELLGDDGVIAALTEAASEQSPVRVLVDVPRRNLVPLIGVAHLELRIADQSGPCAVLRVADRMLAYLNVPGGEVDERRPLLELKLAGDRGLFTRLASIIETLWDQADDTVRTDTQLREYLVDSSGSHEHDAGGYGDGVPAGPEPVDDARRSGDGEPHRTQDPGAGTPRRWPRRPDRS
jgi:transcriptional regulator with XRE-family HTH domain